MKLRIMLSLIVCLAILSWSASEEKKFVQENYAFAKEQLGYMLKEAGKTDSLFPRTTNSAGKMTGTNMYDWTPGFFPGSLWYVYEYTKDPAFKQAATGWTEKLRALQYFTHHHDLGFMMYCSYGNAYRLTGKEAYKNILVQAARSLATRFNATTGTIKSWNRFPSWRDGRIYQYPVIIDNMMNLELLFFASRVSGDSSFKHIAVSHAEKTLQYQIRPDYSCYHVVCYDSATGKVLARETAQGYADNSIWSRGQAWGIYGFTMVYRETKDPKFLNAATRMADCFLNNKNLPADKIPYWDFNINEPGYSPGARSYAAKASLTPIPRDASAAAIVASALIELSTYCNKESGKKYQAAARQILYSLASPAYRAQPGSNGNFLLMHSTGSLPHHSEIDAPLVYADYYFLEALSRYNHLVSGEKILR